MTKQEAYAERQRAAGMRQVTVWVPDGAQSAILSLASRLREVELDSQRESVPRKPRGRGSKPPSK